MVVWYWVLKGDLHFVCKVRDAKQAEKIAKACGGTVKRMESKR